MNESLEQFADDYTECVLALIDRLHADEPLDPVAIHETLSQRLTEARQSHHHDDRWEEAMYALVSLTDELLLEMPWSGRSWWNDHVLEASLFGSRDCSERFYQMAAVASRESSNGVLRVFHDCVLLGFRGVYSIPGLSEATTKELGIPATLELWLEKTQHQLSSDAAEVDPPARLHRSLSGAAPNTTRRSIVWWTVAAATMLIANITMYTLSAGK
ncbi:MULTISPECIES: DotU family type IV/VI secretion system protein [Rhodopirellula]|jgi:type VI secretion system protein ImpK|uniref:Type IV / VI secretion system, DotU domain protein n=1 Tax=Rhodopirellula europaea SH398 TaxID=1263868 RepID=M5RYL2_9BACT|nr:MULTISPECIES: DotU family type IV/VI secretion system protein [Rhodopirellula]EMI24380.1 Type IV / VI secretion system, DotU domain protein [Rhodopirellula europaea SH398]